MSSRNAAMKDRRSPTVCERLKQATSREPSVRRSGTEVVGRLSSGPGQEAAMASPLDGPAAADSGRRRRLRICEGAAGAGERDARPLRRRLVVVVVAHQVHVHRRRPGPGSSSRGHSPRAMDSMNGRFETSSSTAARLRSAKGP